MYYLSWAGKPLTQEQLIEVFATGHWPASAHVDAATPTRYVIEASLSWDGFLRGSPTCTEALNDGGLRTFACVSCACACRYGEKASRWVRVKEDWTLHDVLSQKDMVVPGIPMFAAVARGTEFRQRFLRQNDS